jgi:hypothetical protein
VSGKAWHQRNLALSRSAVAVLAICLASTSCTHLASAILPSTVLRKPDVILNQADHSDFIVLDRVTSMKGLISFDQAIAVAVNSIRELGWLKTATSVQAFLGTTDPYHGRTIYRVIFTNVPMSCLPRLLGKRDVTVDARSGRAEIPNSACP